MDMHGMHCLRFWLETFKDYPTWILCDRTEEDGLMFHPEHASSGAERAMALLVNDLVAKGHDVKLVTVDHSNIDAFVVSTPNGFHEENSIQILNRK